MRVDPNYVAKLASAIGESSAREQRLTDQLSSGLRVASLSDDPVAASSNVLLSGALARLDSFVQSSSRDQSMLQVSDAALGEVVTQVTAALNLGVSAGNATMSPTNLLAIGRQIADIRDSVLSLGNTSYLGSYVFSGTQGQTKPFVLDPTIAPPSVTYHGDGLTEHMQTPDGQQVQLNVPGSSLFMANGSDLFAALNTLIADVNGGATGKLPADTAAMSLALGTLSQQRSTLGAALNRLSSTSGYAQTQRAMLESQQSALLSADPAVVASDLKTAEVQHQALLAVESALSQTNLFSYLK